MATEDISIGGYIVRRIKEQGVKVRPRIFVIFTQDLDLGGAVYIRSPGIVSCQFPGMSILLSS